MKNKIILTSLILSITSTSSFSIANNYFVVIKENKFTENEFLETGLEVCSNTYPLEENVYKSVSFTQEKSNCKKETVNEFGKKIWIDTPDQIISKVGQLEMSNCKEIKTNSDLYNLNLSTGEYPILVNGSELTVSCDMDVDGGGWTFLAEQNIQGSGQAPNFLFSDKNLQYSQVLFFDLGTNQDYEIGSYPAWNWQGMDLGKNAFMFDNEWYNTPNYFSGGCQPILEKNRIALSEYNILERNLNVCYENNVNMINNCGTKVIVNVPSGKKVQGYSDLESISNCSTTNDSYNYKYKILVR